MKRQTSDTPDKPVFDENAFQQLLSAAYVLQQHKEKQLGGKEPESAFSKVLNQVLEIQQQIRHRTLDLQAAATLIAKRVREYTAASGAAVGILDGSELEYYAATGSSAGEVGSRAPADLSLSSECLAGGEVLNSPDTEIDPRVRPDLCRPLGIRGLIAVPIVFEAKVSGVLELHFSRPNSLQDQDVRVAQLLASLLGEALGKEREFKPAAVKPRFEEARFEEVRFPEERFQETRVEAKRFDEARLEEEQPEPEPKEDRAAMLAALEKIKPQLQRLAGAASASGLHSQFGAEKTASLCESCGHTLGDTDPFCGACGAPRRSAKTWSSLWDLQREAEKTGARPNLHAEEEEGHEALDVLPSELENIVAQFSMDGDDAGTATRELPPPSTYVPEPSHGHSNGNGSRGSKRHAVTSAYADPSSLPDFSGHGLDSAPNYGHSESLLSAVRDESIEEESVEEESVEEERPFDERAEDAGTTSLGSESPWSSAAKTKAWFETEHRESWLLGKWRRQRANIYLSIAAGVLIVVLFGLESPDMPAAPSHNAASKKALAQKTPPAPELSPSEKILVGLGLAEAPSAPAYQGNPETKVWVDTHTALYYCPGSSLYGKSKGGRYTSQKDAQQDSFQPASRRACD